MVERRVTQFVRVPPYEISVSLTNYILFCRNQLILWGKKCTALFQTHIWEKSIFSTHLYVYLHKNTQIRDRRGLGVGASRVNNKI